MKVLVLNGNPRKENTRFDEWLDRLKDKLAAGKSEVLIVKLRDKKINFCIGCYTCWLKTPGICVHKDDMPDILAEYVNSDVVLYASPLVMGNISYQLKAVQERLIPTILPYLCIKDNRMQHPQRYAKTQSVALLLGEKEDPGEVSVVEKIFSANRRRQLFVKTMDSDISEVAHAINGI
jgi:multimeric flavodoxin WrbA